MKQLRGLDSLATTICSFPLQSSWSLNAGFRCALALRGALYGIALIN
ncbi:hypothetical protein T01_15106 [Trichinella spiralis]|uniref:Uncharacterized protein n=1 Tax=Trichinella spiralis TaxID=6334 RepID=A0A0V0Z8Y0_TRISP|nr:hypothetical protein T01_15106 [Trichinella spiralis]